MKNVKFIMILIGIMSLLAGRETFAETTLQSKIAKTPEGGTLHLNKGIYHETIVLKKSIHLIGSNGTTFESCSSKPVMTITGKNVTVRGIRIKVCKNVSTIPAIYMSGRNHQLNHVTIHSGGVGVKLVNADHTLLMDVQISGMGRERGCDLWQSNRNTFKGNVLDHVQDGFYLENSHLNTFSGNKVSHSRYGFHVMFSDFIDLEKNISVRNTTGAMIMGSHQTTIQGNSFMENNQNVNAQGLLLYDTHQSIVENNIVKHNKVGMYIDHSSDNKIINNQISANFIGAQFNNMNKTIFERNSITGNVCELQAIQGSDNRISQNYWDAAWKLDTNGNGTGKIPYRADPYFFNLIAETPEYQLFFQEPGMIFLQKMLKSPEQGVITDASPLVKNSLSNNARVQVNTKPAWMMSISMVVLSLVVMTLGRKRE